MYYKKIRTIRIILYNIKNVCIVDLVLVILVVKFLFQKS